VLFRSESEKARQAERERIAADFHDGPQQSFISLQMRLEVLRRLLEQDPEAARRELLEETGFEADDFEMMFSGTVSPGITNEIYNIFLAINARLTGRGGGVGNEAIEVFLKPRHRLIDYLVEESLMGDSLVDSKIPTALMLAQKYLLPEHG